MGDWWQLALLQQPVQQERTCNEGYKYHPGQLLVSEYIFKPFFITVIYPVEQSVSLSICRIRPCIAVKQQIIYRNNQHRHKQRSEKGYRYCHCLVIEKGSGNAAQKYQRNKD